jgi:predicted house-cleaning NTP pyrophosphatase (Maf/HAM1 superfamily)
VLIIVSCGTVGAELREFLVEGNVNAWALAQVVEINGKILEKARDVKEATQMLTMLAGNVHHVHTGTLWALTFCNLCSQPALTTIYSHASTQALAAHVTKSEYAGVVQHKLTCIGAGRVVVQHKFA